MAGIKGRVVENESGIFEYVKLFSSSNDVISSSYHPLSLQSAFLTCDKINGCMI